MSGGDDAEDRAAALAALREQLRDALGRKGLTRKDIVARSAVAGTPLGATTISQALNSSHPAPSWRTVTAVAGVLGADESTLGQLRELWLRTQPRPDAPRPPALTDTSTSTGPSTVRTAGPALLEVHQAPHAPPATDADPEAGATAGSTGAARAANPFLTPYLPRPHDDELERALGPALGGTASAFAVLTGDSSTGKTRALFEALHRLAPNRPLWRPTNAAALADLLDTGDLVPGAVLWLNESQRFLYGDRSEEAAAALRELLMTRTGITAVGTLWTLPYWEDLTRPAVDADPRSQVRALLQAPVTHRVPVPAGLTASERSRWERLADASGDRRMTRAVGAGAADGRVVQHLSGGPGLLAAYRMGPGAHFTHAEHALVTAAVAARQLGHYPPLSEELLTRAADAALPPHLRPAEPDWARDALTALTTGVRADGRRTDIRNTLTALVAVRATSGGAASYEPADYLHQSLLAAQDLPETTPALWDALTVCTTDAHALSVLSMEAQRRNFLKQAVILLRRAVVAGYPVSWTQLLMLTPQEVRARHDMALWMADNLASESLLTAIMQLWDLHGEGPDVTARLAARVVSRVDITNAEDVARLFGVLRELGHEKLLLDLDPGARVQPADGIGAYALLGRLVDEGYTEPAARLADRLLSHGTSLGNARASLALLRALHVCAHRPEEWEALSWQAAHHADLSDLHAALDLADELREAGRTKAACLLADRIAEAAEPEDTKGVASLMYELRCLGMTSACRRLAERAVPEVALEDPEAVGWLLDELHSAGLDDWADTMLDRDHLEDLVIGPVTATVLLLWSFQGIGREDLARRLVLSSMPLVQADEAEHTSEFLDALAVFGSRQELTDFARRAVEEVPLSCIPSVGFLIRSLRQHEQPEALDRLAARAIDAANPLAASSFLDLPRMLRERDLDAHAQALIERATGHPELADAITYTNLLKHLREAGEAEAADRFEATLPTTRGTAPAPPRTPHRARSPYGLETDGTPARPWTWHDLNPPPAHTAPPPRPGW
ncbi:hypothetical protein ACFYYS_33285 [Streptomyces sp. NPDC002120]|uniref:hypothetical protein n=1 Tax=Streptomyces sp. NPDC002120 TaxID=3364631 RepID=UPI0036B5FB6D